MFDTLKTPQDRAFGPWLRYGQSKLANIVYAAELARRYPQLTCVSVHPGVVDTGLISDLGVFNRAFVKVGQFGKSYLTQEEGALSQLWVAAGGVKKEIVNGGFYVPVGVLSNDTLDEVAKSETFATRLWNWTEEALDGY